LNYSIELGAWRSVFAVPSEVVDKHLRLAGAAQLRALLYILRSGGQTISLSEMAMAIGTSEGDAADAVGYWIDCGLLSGEEGQLAPAPAPQYAPAEVFPAEMQETEVQTVPQQTAEQPAAQNEAADTAATTKKATARKREHIRYKHDECMDMIAQDSDLRDMLCAIEGIIAKPLNHTEISAYVTLVRYYGLPTACTVMLVEYCRSIGKSTIAYIEQTGRGWAEEEITTVERAVEKISTLQRARDSWNAVRTALDIPDRKPTQKESEFCSRWLEEMQLGIEMVKLAYERCVDSKGRLSMSYMNGILTNWHKKGLTTPEAVLAETAPASAPSERGAQGRYAPTYDKTALEQQLLDEWLEDMTDDTTDGQ